MSLSQNQNSVNYIIESDEESIVFENSEEKSNYIIETDEESIVFENENKLVSCDSSISKDLIYLKKNQRYIDLRKIEYKDIYCKLNDGESEAVVSYNDENITCLRDIDTNTPKHFVIVSNKIPSTSPRNLGELSKGLLILMKKYNFNEKDCRLIMRTYKNNKMEKTLYLLVDFNN